MKDDLVAKRYARSLAGLEDIDLKNAEEDLFLLAEIFFKHERFT